MNSNLKPIQCQFKFRSNQHVRSCLHSVTYCRSFFLLPSGTVNLAWTLSPVATWWSCILVARGCAQSNRDFEHVRKLTMHLKKILFVCSWICTRIRLVLTAGRCSVARLLLRDNEAERPTTSGPHPQHIWTN